jgi:hypothetical protein
VVWSRPLHGTLAMEMGQSAVEENRDRSLICSD